MSGALLRMNVVLRGSTGHSDQVDNMIARIVKQNVGSKVQPVSSLTWCSILRTLSQGNTSIGVDGAMARYNSHTEVVALQGGGEASGAISLDNRKKQDQRPFLLNPPGPSTLQFFGRIAFLQRPHLFGRTAVF